MSCPKHKPYWWEQLEGFGRLSSKTANPSFNCPIETSGITDGLPTASDAKQIEKQSLAIRDMDCAEEVDASKWSVDRKFGRSQTTLEEDVEILAHLMGVVRVNVPVKVQRGDLVIFPLRRKAFWKRSEIEMKPAALRLIALLSSQPGRVWSRSDILIVVEGKHKSYSDHHVPSLVKNLRKKFRSADPSFDMLVCHPFVGYSWSVTERCLDRQSRV